VTARIPEGPIGPVSARIRALRPSLSRTGGRVADVVTADPARVVELTVTDLAERSDTSVASVVRFCQDLGLRGFGDLKLRLAREHQPETPATPDTADVLAGVLRAGAAALTDAVDTVDRGAFAASADALARAAHVIVLGVGTSAPIAQDAAYRLRGIGLLAEAPPDAHVQHVAARLLGPGAVCVAISHTGQTRETLTAAAAARDAGAPVVAVTSFFRSPLTELCDHALVAGSAETHHRIEARASRLVHAAVLDGLHAAVVQRLPDRARAAADRAAHAVADHRL
jgi:DNA-binding MurR/RpiR family transcriptional regulator